MKLKQYILTTLLPLSIFWVVPNFVSADIISQQFVAPDFDRWMYPYNFNPGARQTGVTFSSVGSGFEQFDDRDGQIVLGFVTQDEIPAALALTQYTIQSIEVTLTCSNADNVYDDSVDSWESYDIETGVPDDDAGRPVELYGAAFRGGYTGWSFGEDGTFPVGAVRRERNVYPIQFIDGIPTDVSNSVLDEFTAEPFAVGTTSTVLPGEVMPSETVLTFSIDVSDPEIQCYFKKSLQDGLMNFVVNSLHTSQQPGFRDFRGIINPNFHFKESFAVQFGLADAAQLSIVVAIADSDGIPEDLDGDGSVGIGDVLVVLGSWGSCSCCSSDLNGDGDVNVSDLLALIAAWDS